MKELYHNAVGKILKIFPTALDKYMNFNLAVVTFLGYIFYISYLNSIYPSLYLPLFAPALITLLFVASNFTLVILIIQLILRKHYATNRHTRRYKHNEPTK